MADLNDVLRVLLESDRPFGEAVRIATGTTGLQQAKLTFQLAEAAFGASDPDTIATRIQFARGLFVLGRFSEAEPLFRQTLEIDCAMLGESHPKERLKNLPLSA